MSFTVLTAEFSHESNTFSRCPADYAAFTDRGIKLGLSQLFVLVGIKLDVDVVDFLALCLHLLRKGSILRTDLLIGSTECL